MRNLASHIFLLLIAQLLAPLAWGGSEGIFARKADLSRELDDTRINVFHPSFDTYLWVGTVKGLYRWDGLEAVRHEPGNGSVDQEITAITGTDNGLIYAGLKNGDIWIVENGTTRSFKPEEGTASSRITGLLVDGAGRLWWSTYGEGIYCHTGERVFNFNTDDGLPDDYIYDIEKGPEGAIWVGTDRGIAVCNLHDREKTVRSYGIEEGLPDLIVKKIARSDAGVLWFGFDRNGICRHDAASDRFIRPEIENAVFGSVTALACLSGEVWVADNRGQIFRLPRSGMVARKININGILPAGKITGMVADDFGYLWLRDSQDVYVSSGSVLGLITSTAHGPLDELHSVAPAGNGGYWVASDPGLVKTGNEDGYVHLEGLLEPTVKFTEIAKGHNNVLWISTFGKGIIRYDPATRQSRIIDHSDGLINDNVLALSLQGDHLWAATLGGASRLSLSGGDVAGIRSYNKDDGLSNNFIYDITEDPAGDVWFATDGNGLVQFDGNSFTAYDESSGLEDDVIYSLFASQQGDIWFSTSSGLLYRYDKNTFRSYGRNEGLAGEFIYSITGSSKYIFILTDRGLNILDQNSSHIVPLLEELGLEEIVSDLNSYCLEGPYACFATYQGIIRIDTAEAGIFAGGPLTGIDRVRVNLRAMGPSEARVFRSSQNQFTFDYSAFWPLAPERVQFQVMLQGYDPTWQTTYNRSVNYAMLRPGSYEFRVRSFISAASEPDNEASYTFTISKPFYARTWFVVFSLLLTGFAIYTIIKYRERRLREAEERKKERIEFEFQTLKNQVNPHFLFNSFSTLISMIEEDPGNAVEYTEKLSDFFRDILEVRDTELIPLREELRLIRNYQFIQQKRFGEHFRLKISIEEKALTSFIPPLTLQLLTENAVKHNIISRARPLTVFIRSEGGHITVENNRQPKPSEGRSTGIGLQNIRKRYRIITDEEVLVEETTKVFRVVLPIIWKER